MSAPGQAGGTSLLLIFSAIDLLCSAMVCGVILVVVLIGGSGNSVTASEGEGSAVGVTLVEAWVPPATELDVEGSEPTDVQAQKPSDIVRSIVPSAARRKVYILPPGQSVLRIRATGNVAAVIHAGTGDSLVVSISCQPPGTALALYLAPAIKLPTCIGGSNAGPWMVPENSVVCAPPVPPDAADPFLVGSVVRVPAPGCSPNQGYTSKRPFTVPSELGVWAVWL